MIRALASLPLARLRAPRGWAVVVPWSLLAIAAAASARADGLSTGADHVLRGSFASAVLPLLAYGLVSASLGGRGLRDAGRGLVAIGASPSRAALATSLVAMASSAAAAGLLAVIVCVIAHGSADAPLLWDVPASFGVAAVGGAAYAAYFAAGSAIGRGSARAVLLAADFLLGAAGGLGSLLTPRAHVVGLLGGPASAELSRRASSLVLVLLALAYLLLAVRLGRRTART